MKKFLIQEEIDMSPTFYTSSPIKNEKLKASYAFMNTAFPRLHGHSNYCEILFVYKGTVDNYINGKWKSMTAGDCCLIQKDDIHKVLCFNNGKNKKEFLGINFLIREDYFEKLKLLCDDNIADEVFGETAEQKSFHVSEQEAEAIYQKALVASQGISNDDIESFEITSKLLIVKLMLRYIEQFYNVEEKSVPDWLLQLLADIQNPDYMPKGLAEYIQDIPYSYSYIAKEFKKYMDCSMISHITAVKLNYAVELLENTTLSSLDICAKLGYNSLSHYNYIFKKFFGHTPSYYRKHRKDKNLGRIDSHSASKVFTDKYLHDKYDIIVVAGQSNAAGTGSGETNCPYVPTDNVLMLVDDANPYFDNNSEGIRSLFINVNTPMSVVVADEQETPEGFRRGQFQLSFGKEYYEKYLQDTDRKVLIVQAAVGGTCFARKEWGAEGTVLYDRLVKMTEYALSLNSENRLVAFLWHQGESDAMENPNWNPQRRYEIHKKNLTMLFDSFCSNFHCPELPMITAGFVNEWYQKNTSSSDAIYQALEEVFSERNGIFVDASMLKSNNEQIGDGDDIHFSRDSLQRLGKLFFDGFIKLNGQK